MDHLQVLAAGETISPFDKLRAGPFTQKQHQISFTLKGHGATLIDVLDQSQHPHHRRGIDRLAPGLIVEADIAADDRYAENLAGLGHPPDALFQLPVDLKLFRIAEVEAVGDGQGPGAGTGEIPRRFRNRYRPAGIGIEIAIATVAIGGQGNTFAGPLYAQHRGIAPRSHHGVNLDVMVVLAIDQLLASDIRRGKQLQQNGGNILAEKIGSSTEIKVLKLIQPRWRHAVETVEWGFGEKLYWRLGYYA